jgi:hypothetical protein
LLVIRRESLLQDAVWEISRQRPLELLKPLRIVFHGEEGADAGGLKKEFFQLLMEQVFDPSYGMFVLNEESRTYWFSDNGLATEEEYAFVGTLMGLAITVNINEIEQFLARSTGQDIFPRDVYYFDRIPTEIQPMAIALVNLGSVGIAVLFSILPALRAAFLHPVRALRFE